MASLAAVGMTMSQGLPRQEVPTGDLRGGVDEDGVPPWYKKYEREFEQRMAQTIEAKIDEKWKQKENNWENERKKLKEQINALRDEVLRLRIGNITTILVLRDNWRSHEDKGWLLPHIDELCDKLKKEYKGNEEVLEELNKLYEQAKGKRIRRTFGSAAAVGGSFAAGAGVTACVMTLTGMEAVGIAAAVKACAMPLVFCGIAGLGVFALVAGGIWVCIKIAQRNSKKEKENNKKNH